MPITSVDGTLSYLAVIRGIPIITSKSLAHSAKLIAKLVRHAVHGLGYPDPGLSARNAPQDPALAGIHLLTSIPGVSATIAKRLIERFGSVAGTAAAAAADLRAIAGIGGATAASIRVTLNGASIATPS